MQNKILGVIVGLGGLTLGGFMMDSYNPDKYIFGLILTFGSIVAGIAIYNAKNKKKGTE